MNGTMDSLSIWLTKGSLGEERTGMNVEGIAICRKKRRVISGRKVMIIMHSEKSTVL